MGLDLSIYEVKKYNNVPFGVIYNQVTDEILAKFLKENEEQKNKEIQYYKDEGFYTGEFLDKIIKRTEKRYKHYEEMVKRYNKEYNRLNEEEKKEIKKLEQIEYKYYGKNWDLKSLLCHELCGDVFDEETQTPTNHLEKEVLEEVFKIEQKKNEENEGISHLRSFIDKADFDQYYYFVEAWY